MIEVADTSLADDREFKARLYARAGIPVYWIINLVDFSVEVYSQPARSTSKSAYRMKKVYGPDDFAPLIIRGKAVGRIPVKELFGKI